ncbi:TPA: EbsA family protein [Streptococcus equi subsp. zooepidemicus]|uniref:Membrane protein n=4 Tax=Streptococcus equi subsp. zooepidemicus TaxID=40041 RepID=A0A2X3T9Q4_STRSZ|nr:EbsA family protein [Streptococcus equi]KIS17891.1 membrane protein [Streptococcus equi subsp. zooepidemicus Sz4is]VED85424.1 membrane protein [Streptococcus equi subsp. equi]HEL1016691.1 EbsA family protein [Streptococcus equi subsp. ruminatorum]AEJ25146.1 membrane protein [Streptococcus equi subsp. zooepidemicus ATCC 35246]AIA67711.1 pore forming protein [Streptococcus equi subsp. zooepidemicus CY]
MIKLFGKVRYHWQPELSWSIIYWSIAVAPIFIGLSLLYERTEIPSRVFVLFALFAVLVGLGLHRYFVIENNGVLKIVSLKLFAPHRLMIASITKIEVTKSTVCLFVGDKSYLFYMRKWPKKYFLDDLAINPYFKGEVILLDNFIKLDYFEAYQYEKKPLTRG